jgi:hypothetical protein
MRTEARKFENIVLQLPVDQHEIGADMAISMISPLADRRMIDVARRIFQGENRA